MTGFPLLRLPLLPLKNVLDMVYIGDLIRLHVCSKKTRQLLKTTKKTVHFENLSPIEREKLNILETLDLLRVETYNDPRGSLGCFPENSLTIIITIESGNGIEVQISDDYCSSRYKSCFPLIFYVKRIAYGRNGYFEFDGITVPVVMKERNTIHAFWKDQSGGLAILVQYLKKCFNVQTIDYFINGSKDPMFSQNLKTVVKGMAQQTITNCSIYNGIMNDDDYKLILDNVKPTYSFEQINPLKSQSNDFRHKTSFSSVFFQLSAANWFSFQNLITTDCKNITLKQSRLLNNDMCNYLKIWMTGKFSKLKRLTVELRECVNLEYILFELESYLKIISLSGDRNSSKLYKFVREVDDIDVIKAHKTVAKISKPYEDWAENVFQFSVE